MSMNNKLLGGGFWEEAKRKCKDTFLDPLPPPGCGSVGAVDCYATFLDYDKFEPIRKKCQEKCGPPRKSISFELALADHSTDFDFCHSNSSVGYLWLKGLRLKMITISEVPKTTLMDLFGLIGGYLGLFVGVSLTTIVEFLEFGVMGFVGRCLRRRRQTEQGKDLSAGQP